MWPEVFEAHQAGSYNQPAIPPSVEPDSGPLVCVQFNASWLPFVLGSLMQLVNPSSWLVADETTLELALNRATKLLDLFGQAGDCMPYALRFTDTCQLQFSVDGEETWNPVAGWVEGFATCFPPQTQVRLNANCNLQESFDGGSTWPNVPGWADNFRDCTRLEVGPPPPQPYPPTLPPASQACAIATQLVQAVIRGSMTQAVNSINAEDSIAVFGVALLALIPGVDLVVAGVLGGGAALFEYINSGRITAFNTAAADDSYFSDMVCRVQAAIADVGYITPDNWPTVLAAIGSTPYSDSDVQFAVAQFAASMGFSGANEMQQIGTLQTADCGGCGGDWCSFWQSGVAEDLCDGDWVGQVINAPTAATCSDGVFNSVTGFDGSQYMYVQADLSTPKTITTVRSGYINTLNSFVFGLYDASFTLLFASTSHNWRASDGDGPIANVSFIRFDASANPGATFELSFIKVGGPDGPSPWLLNNGVCD